MRKLDHRRRIAAAFGGMAAAIAGGTAALHGHGGPIHPLEFASGFGIGFSIVMAIAGTIYWRTGRSACGGLSTD